MFFLYAQIGFHIILYLIVSAGSQHAVCFLPSMCRAECEWERFFRYSGHLSGKIGNFTKLLPGYMLMLQKALYYALGRALKNPPVCAKIFYGGAVS
jgi:hypothetical protein